MKRVYVSPVLEIDRFSEENIITSSNTDAYKSMTGNGVSDNNITVVDTKLVF